MAGYSQINNVALKETASAMVFDKFVQDILHVNGKGVDEKYTTGEVLNSQSIAIPKVALGGGAFRKLGASVNGGQFNSKGAVISTSDYIYVPLLYVYDRVETLAKIMNDKAGYDLLGAKTDNLRRKITRGINALTFAAQISKTLNDSVEIEDSTRKAGTLTYITESATSSAYDCFVDANTALSEGDESIECDYFPEDMRQAFVKPSFFAEFKKGEGKYITQSNLGQEMMATGFLNPFKNDSASKVTMRNGYAGDIDGVPVYQVSPILWKLAAKYCQLTETAFDKIDAMVCSAVGTIRGITSTTDIEVVPSTEGQGWILQPLVQGGVECISGKSVRLIVKSDFVNPSITAEITVLPIESQASA